MTAARHRCHAIRRRRRRRAVRRVSLLVRDDYGAHRAAAWDAGLGAEEAILAVS